MSNLVSFKVTKASDKQGIKRAFFRDSSLDGLKGLAFVLSVFYIFDVPGFRGAFLVGDIFFVLSGFLVTNSIMRAILVDSNFKLAEFYKKLLVKFYIPLTIVLATIVFSQFFLGSLSSLKSFAKQALASQFFAYNWYYLLHVGSLGQQVVPTNPFGNFWFISVIFQFYLFWPIFLYLELKYLKNGPKIASLNFAFALISFTFSAIASGAANGIEIAYFSTFSRLCSLLIGASLSIVLASLSISKEKLSTSQTLKATSWLLLSLLIIILLLANPFSRVTYEGLGILFDLLFSIFLAIIIAGGNKLIANSLSFNPLPTIGRNCYYPYLIIVPIKYMLSENSFTSPGFSSFLIGCFLLIPISFFASALFKISKKFLTNFAFRSFNWVGHVLTAALALSLIVFSSIQENSKVDLPSNFAPAKYSLPSYLQGSHLKVLYLGDSVAFTLGFWASDVSKEFDIFPIDDASIGCGVMSTGVIQAFGPKGPAGPQIGNLYGFPQVTSCSNWPTSYKDAIESSNPDAIIFLAGRWELFDRSFSGGKTWEHLGQPGFDNLVLSQLEKAFSIMESAGVPIIALTCPYFYEGLNSNHKPYGRDSKSRVDEYNKLLREAASHFENTHVFDLNKLLAPQGHFARELGGIKIFDPDGVHLVQSGSYAINTWLLSRVVKFALQGYNNQIVNLFNNG